MAEEENPEMKDLLAMAREAFISDPGYATTVAQRAVETRTRKERRQLADNGDD